MSHSAGRSSPPAECPVCGCDVPPRSRSCPGCGADENTGWNDEATRYDGIDLPDTAFEDDHPGQSNAQKSHRLTGVPLVTWIVALLLLAAIVVSFVFRLL